MKTEIVIRLSPAEVCDAIRAFVRDRPPCKGVRWAAAQVEIVNNFSGDAYADDTIGARLHISSAGSGNEAPK